jgi:hypothetical protein
MLSASLNIATFIFFVGFALEFYFVMQGLNSRAFSFLNQFNAPTAIIPGFALSNIFYLRWIKNWKSRVAISIFLDLALFCVSVYLLFFLNLPIQTLASYKSPAGLWHNQTINATLP